MEEGAAFIVNFHDSMRPGSHYVALKCKNGWNMYFDSFGGDILPECLKLCKSNSNETVYNVYRIQDFKSNLCGLFCIDFLNRVHDYDSYNKFLLGYSPNAFQENDKIVMRRF